MSSVGEFGGARGGMGMGSAGGAFVADEVEEEAVCRIAGNEDDAVMAALQDVGAGFEVEAATVVHAGVASVAV